MIDRAHQDANLESDVALTGLVPQLTTPSRDHDHLVDIWFGVQWRQRSAEWEESFARLANGLRPDPRSPSYFVSGSVFIKLAAASAACTNSAR